MILSRTTLLAAGAAGLAARQMSISRRVDMSAADLGTTTLRPVQNGAIRGSSVEAASLWRDNGALVFVVRRPGWPLCREEALGLSELVAIRGGKQRLVGVVKEVAPTKQAANDTVLGVGEFQRDYFRGSELYLDEDKAFYAYLGNRRLLTLGGTLKALLLPWRTIRSFRDVGRRMKEKNIEGNMVGEGLLLGGVLVVDKSGKIIYSYQEKTGTPAPIDAVEEALARLD